MLRPRKPLPACMGTLLGSTWSRPKQEQRWRLRQQRQGRDPRGRRRGCPRGPLPSQGGLRYQQSCSGPRCGTLLRLWEYKLDGGLAALGSSLTCYRLCTRGSHLPDVRRHRYMYLQILKWKLMLADRQACLCSWTACMGCMQCLLCHQLLCPILPSRPSQALLRALVPAEVARYESAQPSPLSLFGLWQRALITRVRRAPQLHHTSLFQCATALR